MTPDRRQKIEAEAREFLQTQGLVVFDDGPGHELVVKTLHYLGSETLSEYNAHVGLVVDLIERLVDDAVGERDREWRAAVEKASRRSYVDGPGGTVEGQMARAILFSVPTSDNDAALDAR